MRAVIISGGVITDYEYIKRQIKSDDTIICADSGYNHAVKMGLKPSIVIGDFDSLAESKIPSCVPCLKFPAKKDQTDTEIAIDYAREKGFRDFLFLAATGRRLDHGLTNILLLKSFLERGEIAVIFDEHNKIRLTDSDLTINEPPNSILSLVPITDCYGVTTKNLEFPLCNSTMLVGKGLGVSNIMTEANATVTVKDGLLLVIVARD